MNSLVIFILQWNKFLKPLTCLSIGTRSCSLTISLLSFSLNSFLVFSFRISIGKLFHFLEKFLISDLSLHLDWLLFLGKYWRVLESLVSSYFSKILNEEFLVSRLLSLYCERRSKNLRRQTFLMKSSAGKILSLNKRSLALSNFLRRWQTFITQFICLLTLWNDLTENDWKKWHWNWDGTEQVI